MLKAFCLLIGISTKLITDYLHRWAHGLWPGLIHLLSCLQSEAIAELSVILPGEKSTSLPPVNSGTSCSVIYGILR